MKFEGLKYLVVGASSATGQQICARLLNEGAHVFGITRNADELGDLAHKYPDNLELQSWSLEEGPDALKTVVQNAASWKDLNLAGLAVCAGSILIKSAHHTKDPEWDQTIALNLTLPFWVARAALPHLTKGHGASMVFFSSVAARVGLPNHEAIAAAKAGLEGLVRSLAATYASRGVRANVIAPSLTRSKMSGQFSDAVFKASSQMHPLKRVGEPGDLASAALWFLSPEQSWVTGQVLGVDGGLSIARGQG
jgi:3-oxoacyl-[acyl-carrier protein] reductase